MAYIRKNRKGQRVTYTVASADLVSGQVKLTLKPARGQNPRRSTVAEHVGGTWGPASLASGSCAECCTHNGAARRRVTPVAALGSSDQPNPSEGSRNMVELNSQFNIGSGL